jgi:hypothetical protein
MGFPFSPYFQAFAGGLSNAWPGAPRLLKASPYFGAAMIPRLPATRWFPSGRPSQIPHLVRDRGAPPTRWQSWAWSLRTPPRVWEKGKAAKFDVARIDEIEREVKHDVIAFLTHLAEIVGPEARLCIRA